MAQSPKTACLLLHGFGGTPFDVEPLIPGLEALGCTVDLPTFPGHGTSIAEFRRTFFPDWLAHAEERFLTLAQSHDLVIPIGFSMGGSIALTLAAKHAALPQAGGVIGLAPAYRLCGFFPFNPHTSWLAFTPLLQYIRPEIPIPGSSAESDAIAPFRGYESPVCLPQLHSLVQGLKSMRALLPNLTCPLLMLYDVNDSVCQPEFALSIAREVAACDVSLRLLRMKEHITSHHMLTTHRDTRDKVAQEVAAFVRGRMELFGG